MIQKTKKLNVAVQKQIKQIKIAIVGDSATGKTTFSSQYSSQKTLQGYQPTLGVETHNKYIQNPNGSLTNVTLWDFSGKLQFLDIRNEFYKQSHMVLIFCDLGTKSTIEGIDYWNKQAKDNGANNIIIIGNKIQNKKGGEAQNFAKGKGYQYYELCSKQKDKVDEVMVKVVSETLKRM